MKEILIERIRNYDIYKLINVDLYDIDEEQWEVDEDRVYGYVDSLDNNYTPVILHKILDWWEIIDGTHRINALKARGEKYVKAYVGYK